MRRRAVPLAAALILACALLSPAGAQTPVPTPLVGEVLKPPRLFPGSDGRRHLVYEVRLANITGGDAQLLRLAVRDGAGGPPLLVLEAEALGARFALGGMRGSETTRLGPQQWGVAFLHLALPPGAPVPASLAHEITVRFDQPAGEAILLLAPASVRDTPPPMLGPPLRGGGYVAGDGCCDSIRHVRALLPLNGALRLAQRFAIDWERIGADGRIVVGDLRDPRSYRIYDEPVLAVADGVVAEARDGLPDQVPGALPQGLPIEEADGNFVVLDIGGGAHVLYAHLRPGSVAVRTGQRVRRGDRLGAVGNSGNSSAPHLHLHVMDGPSPLLADGIPYVFDSVTVTAIVAGGTAAFDAAEATGVPLTLTPRDPPERLHGVLPLDLSIVDWDGGRASR